MAFSLTTEQQLRVDAAKRMVENHIQPILDANDRDKGLPKAAVLKIMGKAAGLGLTSARIPRAGGGAGMTMLDYGLMGEQIPPAVGVILQTHEATTTRMYHGCSSEQKERYLSDLMGGQRITCTASTEPDVGSDPRGIKTSVSEAADHLVVAGRNEGLRGCVFEQESQLLERRAREEPISFSRIADARSVCLAQHRGQKHLSELTAHAA